MVTFSHLDDGTAEERWLADTRLISAPPLESLEEELQPSEGDPANGPARCVIRSETARSSAIPPGTRRT